jgi:hypothetical protein
MEDSIINGFDVMGSIIMWKVWGLLPLETVVFVILWAIRLSAWATQLGQSKDS